MTSNTLILGSSYGHTSTSPIHTRPGLVFNTHSPCTLVSLPAMQLVFPAELAFVAICLPKAVIALPAVVVHQPCPQRSFALALLVGIVAC